MDEAVDVYVEHHHAPPHLFRAGATYFITARTLDRLPTLEPGQRRQQVIDSLRFSAGKREWQLIAWVALPNHYHCILKAPDAGATQLPQLLRSAHRHTSALWNSEDGEIGRHVWYQYWDTCLTYPRSFWARVNYIHYNPVRHGLVSRPKDYPFSSYTRWQRLEEINRSEIEEAHPWDRLDLEQ